MAIAGTVYQTFSHGIRIDEETAYATGGVAADAVSLGKVTNFNTNIVDNVLRLLGIGEGRNETSYVYGNVGVTGTIEWDVLADITNSAGGSISFMRFFFGKAQGSGTTAAPYELVECDSINYSTMYSFAIWSQNEAGTTDDVDLYQGCVAGTLSLSGSIGSTLKASMDFTAKNVTSSTSITTAYATNTTNPWVMQQGAVQFAASPSSNIEGVQSFTLTMNNSLFTYYSIDQSRFIEKPEFGRRLYDFTIVAKMTSNNATALRDVVYGQANSFITGIDPSTRTDIQLRLIFAEGTASGDKKMQIDVDKCTLTSMSKPVPIDGNIVEITVTGFGQSGLADATDIVPLRYWAIT